MGCGGARPVTRDMQLDSSEKLKSTFSSVDLWLKFDFLFFFIFLYSINSITYAFIFFRLFTHC